MGGIQYREWKIGTIIIFLLCNDLCYIILLLMPIGWTGWEGWGWQNSLEFVQRLIHSRSLFPSFRPAEQRAAQHGCDRMEYKEEKRRRGSFVMISWKEEKMGGDTNKYEYKY